MRTIGRRARHHETATGLCDYCGTRWYMSDLYRDAAGLLSCPQEGRGRDAVTLTRANVASAKEFAHRQRRKQRAGRFDRETAEPISIHTFDDTFGEEFS